MKTLLDKIRNDLLKAGFNGEQTDVIIHIVIMLLSTKVAEQNKNI